MKYRALTVNREFGSGGGRIAQTIAGWLGWKLLDRDIIDAIAYAAHVDSSVVRHYDEHVDSWLRRLNQQAMRSAALAAGLELREGAVFDAEEMVKLRRKLSMKPIPKAIASSLAAARNASCSTSPTHFTSSSTPRSKSAFCASALAWRRAPTSSSASAPSMENAPNICRSISARAGATSTSTT